MSNPAEQIDILRVRITAERFREDGFLDVQEMVTEINMYSHMSMPFLTGNMVMFDDLNVFGDAQLQGTERVEFSYRNPAIIEPITRRFVITDISSTKTNDQTAQLVMGLVEDIGYHNNVHRFSKSYTGDGETILNKIVNDGLGLEIQNDGFPDTASIQGAFRYIVPYQTTFEACAVVLQKMTTEAGLPFFLYKGFNNDKVTLTNLETILRKDPGNFETPFQYSQSNTASNDQINLIYNVNTYDEDVNEATMQLIMNGGLKSRVQIMDITSGDYTEIDVNMLTVINELVRRGITRSPIPLIDEAFVPNPADGRTGDTIMTDTYDPHYSSVVAAETYPLSALGFGQERRLYQHSLKAVRKAMLMHLYKNTYTITGPGAILTTGSTDYDVGKQIRVDIQDNTLINSKIDERRSGTFIITAQRLRFSIDEKLHTYSMDISRITNDG